MIKLNKFELKEEVFDVNLVFYNFLKKITQAKFADSQINNLLSIFYSNSNSSTEVIRDQFASYVEENIKRKSLHSIFDLFTDIDENNLDIFIFSLKLNLIKDLLLSEAKIAQVVKAKELGNHNPLSLAYDKTSTQVAYSTRVSGALLSLMFFEKLSKSENFLLESTSEFIKDLSVDYKNMVKKGLEPNQIFMLLFSESVDQSILSTAGVSYEDRIKHLLISIGIPSDSITKTHDDNDSSTEFDFFFTFENKTYGIGAKRTLRERYKQFIKTSHMSQLNVMIEITLGTDLRETIAKAIRSHGVYIFVADEIYESKKYLQEIDGIYPASELNINLLRKLK